jgi:hypothetical protein
MMLGERSLGHERTGARINTVNDSPRDLRSDLPYVSYACRVGSL